MKLIIVRHGATEWSLSGQHTGLTDLPLTELGRRQAESAKQGLAKLLGAGTGPTEGALRGTDAVADAALAAAVVYSSPLRRALSTATIVTGRSEREIISTPTLCEYDYGDYEGLTPAQVRALRPGWDVWRDGCPGGESTEDVGARARQFIALAETQTATVIAFAHGHIARIVAACAVGLEPRQGLIFTLDTATISVIEDVRGKRVVKVWNLDPRLLL